MKRNFGISIISKRKKIIFFILLCVGRDDEETQGNKQRFSLLELGIERRRHNERKKVKIAIEFPDL